MLTYRKQEEPPHLVVKMAGVVTLGEMTTDGTAIETTLARTPPGAVFLIDTRDFLDFEPEAAGVAFYLTEKVFRAKPRLLLIVNGGQVHHATFYSFTERLDTEGKLRFFDTEAAAMDFLKREAEA